MKDKICVGAVAGSFGVKGEIRLKSFCAEPEDIAGYNPLSLEDGGTVTLKLTGQIKNGLAARLDIARTKEQAEALKGTRLYADRTALPHLPDDEFYHTDLMGLEVVDTGGMVLGKVAAVHNHGAGDLLEVRGAALKGSALLPFTREAVPTVDLTTGRIVTDPPDGVFTFKQD
ncbi:ribosome maturation factor RimM [Tropicimonas sp. S265A]|uniref:ribosome maturation factor RimM n=1 Tax=Tropicimonas sp. S265A TaxID=3415134 RepID=UPI003C7DFC34